MTECKKCGSYTLSDVQYASRDELYEAVYETYQNDFEEEHLKLETTLDQISFEVYSEVQYDKSNGYTFTPVTSSGIDYVSPDGTGLLSCIPSGWTDENLGLTAIKFASNDKGAGTISVDYFENNSYRYGIYGFSDKTILYYDFGRVIREEFSTLRGFLAFCGLDSTEFKNLVPNSAAFVSKWKELSLKDPYFEEKQKEFMKKQFDIVISNFYENHPGYKDKLNWTAKDVIFSTLVEFGGNTAKTEYLLNNAVRNRESTDNWDFIDYIFRERYQVTKYHKVEFDDERNARMKALMRERQMRKEQYGNETGVPEENIESLSTISNSFDLSKEGIDYYEDYLVQRSDEVTDAIIAENDATTLSDQLEAASIPGSTLTLSIASVTSSGFLDPDGTYPIPDRVGEPDFHRLARGNSVDTLVTIRNGSKITGVPKADGTTWDEPDAAYKSEYPHNYVFSTHGGVTMEMDSTPNNERYQIWHPSNTFTEIGPKGDITTRSEGNRYDLTKGESNSFIVKDQNITVNGNRTLNVVSDEYKVLQGNRSELIKKTLKQHVEETYNLVVDKNMQTGVNQSLIENVKMNHEQNIGENKLSTILRDHKRLVGGNETKKVKGDEDKETRGNYKKHIDGTYIKEVGGTKTVTIGGETKHNSGGAHYINAPVIYLNS